MLGKHEIKEQKMQKKPYRTNTTSIGVVYHYSHFP